jgi:hypothetical protein
MSTLTHDEPAVRRSRVAASASNARLFRLHLKSRRVPTAAVALLLCAPLLQWAIRSTLGPGHPSGARVSVQQISLLLEVAAASVVSVGLHGPFGESERIAGRRLPWLRLGAALLLTAIALAAIYAGVVDTPLPAGTYAALRDTAGLIGLGIACTVLIGGHFAWVGPAVYWAVGAYAIADKWQTPWTWPARPGGDVGASLCAYGLLTASLLAITVIGPRQYIRD